MGLRSGDHAGFCKTSIFYYSKNNFVFLDLCEGAPSY